MQSRFGWALWCALVTTGGRLDAQERTTVGGYGEVHYTNATGPNTPGRATLRRFVVYLAHGFDDRLSFRSELEVEDAGTIPGGSGLAYRVYLVNGLRAQGFAAGQGIREGRQEGQDATFANPSLTGRLEWARPGLKLGGSFWYGGSAGADSVLGSGSFDAPVALVSADVRYDLGAASFRAVVANISVRDAGAIDARYGTALGSRIAGGYVEGAYNLLHALAPASSQKLNAFARHERYDTQVDVPAGITRDASLARRITTLGLTYKPTWNTAFKGDYQLVRNAGGVGEHEVLSLGVGYQF